MAREKKGYRDALYKFLHRHDDEEDEQREARMRKEMIFRPCIALCWGQLHSFLLLSMCCSGWDFYEKCKTTSTIIATVAVTAP